MKWSVVACALAIVACADCARFKAIEKDVLNYYTGDDVMAFEVQWHKMKLPIESAIRQSLINMYGRGEMNVFVKTKGVPMTLTRGFLVSDNIVQVLIVNPTMRELPMILAPEVHLCLEGNALRVEGGLSKIFIDAEYILFRNSSAIEYTEDRENVSPFSLSQVQNTGNLAITAEGCAFIGTGMATLLGSSVNLGYNTFRVTDCKFRVEIYTHGFGTPPVMAPYFNKQQSNQLENLMSRPIADEMYTKIQSALLSYVNTSAIFGIKKLPKFIYAQRQIFRKCATYLEKAVRNANGAMMEKNKGVLRFDDWHLKWSEPDAETKISIAIKGFVISGLDTAYSINRGGPYYLKNVTSIAEDFYFHTLHMKGKLVITNASYSSESDFGGEIPDVHISVKVEVSALTSKDKTIDQEKRMNKFCTATARGFELAIPEAGTSILGRFTAHSLISGYMYNTVPKRLVEILSEIFPKAVALDDSRLLKYAVPSKPKELPNDGDDNKDDDNGEDNGGADDPADDEVDNGGDDKKDEDIEGTVADEDNEVPKEEDNSKKHNNKLNRVVNYVAKKKSKG